MMHHSTNQPTNQQNIKKNEKQKRKKICCCRIVRLPSLSIVMQNEIYREGIDVWRVYVYGEDSLMDAFGGLLAVRSMRLKSRPVDRKTRIRILAWSLFSLSISTLLLRFQSNLGFGTRVSSILILFKYNSINLESRF